MVETARKLPAEDQNAVAMAMLSKAEQKPIALDDETRAAIREGLDQAKRGQFAPDEEMKLSGSGTVCEGSLHGARAQRSVIARDGVAAKRQTMRAQRCGIYV